MFQVISIDDVGLPIQSLIFLSRGIIYSCRIGTLPVDSVFIVSVLNSLDHILFVERYTFQLLLLILRNMEDKISLSNFLQTTDKISCLNLFSMYLLITNSVPHC